MTKMFDDTWTDAAPPAGTERIAFHRNPGDAEAAAAIAALHEHTISRDTTLRLGRTVRVPKAFGNGTQTGTIASRSEDRHLGVVWLVDTPEGRLKMLPDEIEVL